jgi:tRNA pseudouridine55 synthase
MFGVLNVYKPGGWSSRDVVNRVQRLVRPHKVGHAGTLDPIATGVLLTAIGPATRLIEYAQRLRKEYRGTFLLGRRSETEDIETPAQEVENAPRPTLFQVQAAAAGFVGEIQQRPSRHSAVKVAGQRAYELARAGADFELAPRPVMIYGLRVIRYEYPELVLDVECGAGTYIRALGRDLAGALGTSAVMTGLERTRVGAFRASQGVDFDRLLEGVAPHVQSASFLVDALKSLTVTHEELRELGYGRAIEKLGRRLEVPRQPTGVAYEEIAAFDAEKNVVAVLVERRPGLLSPVRNFSQPAPSA